MTALRVYIIAPTFLPMVGGTEKQALAHGRSLQERGFEVTILTLRHNKRWLLQEVIESVPVIRVAGAVLGGREKLPGPLRKVMYMLGLLVMSGILWQHRHRYDALHLYHLGLEALPVALVCRLTGRPLIISVRAVDSGKSPKSYNEPTLLAGPLDASASWLRVEKRDQLEGDLAVLESLGRPVVKLTRSLLQRVSAVVVVISSRMQSYLVEHDFNMPGVQLIPNGVDATRFHPDGAPPSSLDSPDQQDERGHVVVCVAKLRYQKGIDVLLQAWYLVCQQMPLARLIIVGDGPLKKQLERMSDELGIGDNVEFASLQSDIPAQFHRGGLAVLPSYWEGMPNTVLEAMACGLPCIATRVSGSEDIIQHGVNGLLVEPGDYQGMAKALLQLLCDQALARQYGQAARVSIEQHYTIERITDSYVALYQVITSTRSRIEEYLTV